MFLWRKQDKHGEEKKAIFLNILSAFQVNKTCTVRKKISTAWYKVLPLCCCLYDHYQELQLLISRNKNFYWLDVKNHKEFTFTTEQCFDTSFHFSSFKCAKAFCEKLEKDVLESHFYTVLIYIYFVGTFISIL